LHSLEVCQEEIGTEVVVAPDSPSDDLADVALWDGLLVVSRRCQVGRRAPQLPIQNLVNLLKGEPGPPVEWDEHLVILDRVPSTPGEDPFTKLVVGHGSPFWTSTAVLTLEG